jgi:hypothetical protein
LEARGARWVQNFRPLYGRHIENNKNDGVSGKKQS